jgi:uncharacterized protein GlcG (DUF336 family)
MKQLMRKLEVLWIATILTACLWVVGQAQEPTTHDKKSLRLATAKRIVEAAAKKAFEIKVPMVIAVVDESGILMLLERMEGAPLISVDVAQNKAYTAAAVRMPTHKVSEIIQPGKPAFGFHTMPRIAPFGGGFPIGADDKVVGGIGVSGGSAVQDMECAQAGLAVLKE